ncbi:MAG: TRAP transporter small permease [Betaproteobacteria bacterium]|nr:TRAP transporter small permease [Betaproteobacteria bacterium]
MFSPSGGPPPTLPPGARFRAERFFGAAAMAALVAITLANVLTRYFTDISLAFTEEVSVFLLVFLTFVGAAKAFLDGNQIAMEFFIARMGWPWKRRFLLFALAMSALMIALVGWFGTRMAWDDYEMEVTSPGLGWPQWIYTAWMPLLCLPVIARIAQGFVHVWRKRAAE